MLKFFYWIFEQFLFSEKSITKWQIGHFFSILELSYFSLNFSISKLINITYVLLQQELYTSYILRFCGWPNNDKKHSKITKTNIVISWDAHLSMQLQEIKPRARCALKFIILSSPTCLPPPPFCDIWVRTNWYTNVFLYINVCYLLDI